MSGTQTVHIDSAQSSYISTNLSRLFWFCTRFVSFVDPSFSSLSGLLFVITHDLITDISFLISVFRLHAFIVDGRFSQEQASEQRFRCERERKEKRHVTDILARIYILNMSKAIGDGNKKRDCVINESIVLLLSLKIFLFALNLFLLSLVFR